MAPASLVGVFVSCFGLTILSAIVPWVNAEVILLSLAALVDSPLALVVLVIVATAGQMVGKCVVYWTGRRSGRLHSPRVADALERWRHRLAKHPSNAVTLVLVSSIVGIPPFYPVTLAAGALGVDFWRFLVAGTVGRLVRFGALAFVPHLVRGAVWM